MATVKIRDIRELPAGEPTRVGLFNKIVMYEVDPTHVHFVQLPAETFTKAKLTEAIQKDMKARNELLGSDLVV